MLWFKCKSSKPPLLKQMNNLLKICLLIHIIMWINLKCIWLRERNRTHRLHIIWFHLCDILKKQSRDKNRLMVARDCSRGMSWLQRGHRGDLRMKELFCMVLWWWIWPCAFVKTHRTILERVTLLYANFQKARILQEPMMEYRLWTNESHCIIK